MGRPVAMFEIVSPHYERAREFYTTLFDWSLQPVDDTYALIDTGAGEAALPGGIGAAAGESDGGVKVYLSVDDLDAYLAKAAALGGTTLVPPTTLPGDYGSFAIVADPDGNAVGLWATTA